MQCIAHTHPVFDDSGEDCSTWTCRPFESLRNPDLSCCMTAMDQPTAARMLNGTIIQFVGDSTSSRAAREMSAFLLQHKFELREGTLRDRNPIDRVLHNPTLGVTTALRYKWMPTAEELRRNIVDVVAAMVDDSVPGVKQGIPPGTAELPLGLLPLPMPRRRILVVTLSSHDIAFGAWNWKILGENGTVNQEVS